MTVTEDTRRAIEVADVVGLGDVDAALGDFYDRQVGIAASVTGVDERLIREWIEAELITEQGFRGQAIEGPGPDPTAVPRVLENGHLLRAEMRRGASWYEISHDRMVEPAVQRNERWRRSNLSDLQVEAVKWEANGRSDALLLRDEVLDAAIVWANANLAVLTPPERELLDASLEESHRILAVRRRNRAYRRVAVAAVVLLGIAIGVIIQIQSQKRAADAAAQSAKQAETEADDARAAAEAETARADARLREAEDTERAAVAAAQVASQRQAQAELDEAAAEKDGAAAETRALAAVAAERRARDAEAAAAEAQRAAQARLGQIEVALAEQGRLTEEAQAAADQARIQLTEADQKLAAASAARTAADQALQQANDLLVEFGFVLAPADTLPCTAESGSRSESSGEASSIDFVNDSSESVEIYWLDFDGVRVKYADLAPGDSYTQGTFLTHPWVVADSTGTCLTIVLPIANPSEHIIT